MDSELSLAGRPPRERYAIFATAVAPVVPQVLGSWFNIWYNVQVVNPLLGTPGLKHRFVETVMLYNSSVYPLAVALWLWLVFSLRRPLRLLVHGRFVSPDCLLGLQRRVVNLPWWGALISGVGWLLCIPVFLIALTTLPEKPDPTLFWHLPTSIVVSAMISMTHSFFLVEVASHWGLFPVFFRNSRADMIPGAWVLSLRGRGILWAISAGICPIGSLILLQFAPPAPGGDPRWFAVFVGSVGVVFGLSTALLISRLVVNPVDHLRSAAQSIAEGKLELRVSLPRPDEFGLLTAEFDDMIEQLKEKEKLRQTFGLHVGRAAAEEILARDPGLGGVEQTVTVMFVDIRAFTARAAASPAPQTVRELNDFLRIAVDVVEGKHRGMINKFLGDGFMALFGLGETSVDHADCAVAAGRDLLMALAELNAQLAASGTSPLRIGIGLHTGAAIVGSIGSPKRLEFTAIGSTVNLASRVEQLTKHTTEALLLTAATAELLTRLDGLVEIPPQTIRGVTEPVRIFTIPVD